MMMTNKIKKHKTRLVALFRMVTIGFNGLPIADKKEFTIWFGIVAGLICTVPVIKGVTGKNYNNVIAIDSIQLPKDIYMRNEKTISEDQLIPVGKFKGEINGEFEAFYLAVDAQGKTFINRSIDFSREAYHKSRGWEEINKEELERFQKELHFLPARSKGIRH
jgi:hypothetical protein